MSFKPYPSENITAVHVGLSNFLHGSLSENIIVVHLGLINLMYSSFFENLTALYLGFSNIMHDSCRHGVFLMVLNSLQ